ncbi:hypothetical protein [Thiothrix subterranea]|uniref:hypothetical protein n=1 Tax=Thiothrix subterranea TaxID=2735563 RepID=UPI0035ABCC1C
MGNFFPREIDDGTDLLLKYLKINPTDDCFDLGCGYWPSRFGDGKTRSTRSNPDGG